MFAGHWDFEKRFAVAVVEAIWQPRRFVAERQGVARFESAVVERSLAVRRQENQALWLCRRKIFFPRVVKRYVEMRPVVESRAGDRAVVEREAEWLYEMERHAQPDAKPADCTRIVRNLRAKEDY